MSSLTQLFEEIDLDGQEEKVPIKDTLPGRAFFRKAKFGWSVSEHPICHIYDPILLAPETITDTGKAV